MPAKALDQLLRAQPAEFLAALGIVSGTLSALWGQSFELEPLKPLARLFFLDPGVLPIGFFYGTALGLGIVLLTRRPWTAIVVPIATMYAWSAAIHTAIRLQRNADDDFHLVAASLAAGAIGAMLTHFGCSMAANERWAQALNRALALALNRSALFKAIAAAMRERRWHVVAPTIVGAAFGMFFYLGERKILDERLLFFLWQPAVAFAIGLGLPRQNEGA